MPTFGLIGGSGLLKTQLPALQGLKEEVVETPAGRVVLRVGPLAGGARLVFVQRHDATPSRAYTQPSDINYAAIALALQAKGCDFVVGIASVGSLKPTIPVGALLVCDDFWSPHDVRRVFNDARAHVLPTFDEPLRRALLECLPPAEMSSTLRSGTYANAKGPRFETRSEIRLMADYCDVVGMTGAHEASACVELALPYAMLACVDNFAHGVGPAGGEELSLAAFHAAQAENLTRVEACVGSFLAGLPLRPELVRAKGVSGGAGAAAHETPSVTHGRRAVDLIVHARWLLPVAAGREKDVFDRHAIVVLHGRILDICPSDDARVRYAPTRTVTLDNHHAILPGFVNAHTHVPMNLMKGVADDMPLMKWLSEQIWPTEGRLVNPAYVRAGAVAAIAELIRSGVTTINEMYFFPEAVADAVEATGLRALIAMVIMEFPTAYASNADEYLSKGLAVRDAWRARAAAGAVSSRVTFSFGPHAPYTVADATFERLHAAATADGARVHLHLHETAGEVLASTTGDKEGMGKHLSAELSSPLANMERLGLLNDRLIAVHMTQLTDDEIARVAKAGAHVVHCPNSNMKLASGFCPVAKLLAAGVNVALGTDGASSNNSLDFFNELKLAATLAKGVSGDATALPAWQALRVATLNGARALGLERDIGSLEVGKKADFIAIDLSDLESLPMYSVQSHLVYAVGRGAVSDVWVDGSQLLESRRLTTIDEAALKADIRAWAQKVRPGETAEDLAVSISSRGAGGGGAGAMPER